MDIRYDIEKKVLQVDGVDVISTFHDENFIGVCSRCEGDVKSLSYHEFTDKFIVAGRCLSCETIFAILYDNDWNWFGEHIISQFFSINDYNDLKLLDSIDKKKIAIVFTPAETDAMYAKARGGKYVRQYLYRARKKYQDFVDLFGIQLNI